MTALELPGFGAGGEPRRMGLQRGKGEGGQAFGLRAWQDAGECRELAVIAVGHTTQCGIAVNSGDRLGGIVKIRHLVDNAEDQCLVHLAASGFFSQHLSRVKAVHFHQPVHDRTRAANFQAPGIAGDRHGVEVNLGRGAAVEGDFAGAHVCAAGKGAIVHIRKRHRFLELVGPGIGDKHHSAVGFKHGHGCGGVRIAGRLCKESANGGLVFGEGKHLVSLALCSAVPVQGGQTDEVAKFHGYSFFTSHPPSSRA